MKRLFYLSGSLFFLSLTLLIGFHLGQRVAESSTEDVAFGTAGTVISSDGEVWGATWGSPVWQRLPQYDPPVPVSEIDQWWGGVFVTTAGDWWVYDIWSSNQWVNAGPPPIQTAIKSQTWGQLKQRFGR